MNIHSESASEILNDYLEQIGGRDALMAAWEEKKQAAKKGKKRGRSNGAKRGRKAHPASGTPPASVKNAEFKPPSGSWEDQVVNIDACEGAEGSVVVYLTWRGGHKTQHPLFQVYKRCPQRVSKLLLR
jgi:chromobox protein 1